MHHRSNPTPSSSRRLWPLLALALVACSGVASETPSTPSTAERAPAASEPAPGPSAPAASAPVAAAPPPVAPSTPGAAGAAPAVRITAPACGYGGSMTAVVVFLDVETDVALLGLTGSFVVTDPATHARIGGSIPPAMLLVSPVARGLLDFSTSGTTPFGGDLAAGARIRLELFAGLDALTPGMGPIDVTATLTAADGQRFDVTCTTAGMWPSS